MFNNMDLFTVAEQAIIKMVSIGYKKKKQDWHYNEYFVHAKKW